MDSLPAAVAGEVVIFAIRRPSERRFARRGKGAAYPFGSEPGGRAINAGNGASGGGHEASRVHPYGRFFVGVPSMFVSFRARKFMP